MYHISDLRQFINCPSLYFINQDNKKDEVFLGQYIRNDYSLIDLLSSYFKMDNYFEGERNQNTSVFLNNIDKYEWFFNVRFDDDGMRVKVPLMHKTNKGYEVYFILYKTNSKDIDLFNYRVTISVLNNIGLKLYKAYTISFNEEYVRKGEIEVDKLFKISSKMQYSDLLKVLNDKVFDYKKVIEEIENTDRNSLVSKKNKACKLLGTCKYYDDCFKNETNLPDDNILTLVSSQYKNELFKKDIIHLKDIDTNYLEGNKIQYAQIMASKNNGLFVDKAALTSWLNRINKKPISFIDFEWDRYLVPQYDGMSPLSVICFEFALYYLDNNNKLEHRTFIGTGDCRREFVEALKKYLPNNGPILAYNATGAEILRLQELKEYLPEYSDYLEDVISRFVDLADPFIEGMIYDVKMGGNFTVKKLVSVVSNYSYKDLDVNDGMDAVFAWRQMDKGVCDKKEEIYEALKEYCSLDSYSLFLIFKWLVEKAIS